MKVELTVKVVYNINLSNYSTDDFREAVAFDFEGDGDEFYGLTNIIDNCDSLYLVDVQEYVGDKHEVALEAEIMSKTLGLDTDG